MCKFEIRSLNLNFRYMATRKRTRHIHTHASSNAVTLVWGSLRLAPTRQGGGVTGSGCEPVRMRSRKPAIRYLELAVVQAASGKGVQCNPPPPIPPYTSPSGGSPDAILSQWCKAWDQAGAIIKRKAPPNHSPKHCFRYGTRQKYCNRLFLQRGGS